MFYNVFLILYIKKLKKINKYKIKINKTKLNKKFLLNLSFIYCNLKKNINLKVLWCLNLKNLNITGCKKLYLYYKTVMFYYL